MAIRTVGPSGLPTSTVLGETLLQSSSAPLTLLIKFPQAIRVTAGTQYAIVVNYPGAPPHVGGTWYGATGNAYPRGGSVYSQDNGVTWLSAAIQGSDSHFQTYVQPSPTSKQQCKHGGWRSFPQFKNQGDCLSFVNTGR